MREHIYTRTQAERLALIETLMTNGKWSLIAKIDSTGNSYYLFGSRNNPSETIGINDGESDFYEDVIHSC